MIRLIVLASLLSVLAIVLYTPSVNPPIHFIALLKAEHQETARFWGEAVAVRVLSRALSIQAATRPVSSMSAQAGAVPTSMAGQRVEQEIALINWRFFNDEYFRSIDALLVLAWFRVAALWEWMKWFVGFAVAAGADGFMVRRVRAKEFQLHDPEMFAIYVCAAIFAMGAAAVSLVAPTALHPLLMPCVPLVIIVLISKAIGNFHGRG